jgi:hypothetical protein
MQHINWILFLSLVFFSILEEANAHGDTAKNLAGTWEGQMVADFQGKVYESPVSIQFDLNHKAMFRMSESEEGSYKTDGDSISIFLEKGSKEHILLYNVYLNQNSLTSNIRLPLDPPGLSSSIHLVKVKGITNLKFTSQDNTCSSLVLPEKVRMILKKYGLRCPISVPHEPTWYEQTIIRIALWRILIASLGDGDLRVGYKDGNFICVSYSYSEEEVKKIIKPLLQEPDRFHFIIPKEVDICDNCAVEIAPIGDLKSEFIIDSKINFSRLWSTILSSAEKVEGIKIDLNSQKQNDNGGVVRTKFRRLPMSDPGYIIAEQITIRMEDDSRRWGKIGEAVGISVVSKILKRGISERRWVEINLGGGARVDKDGDLYAWELESPCMRAILKAIKK